MVASFAADFHLGGTNLQDDLQMECDPASATGKRNQPGSDTHATIDTPDTLKIRGTVLPPDLRNPEPAKKKPYSGHGTKRSKALLRMDFTAAKTKKEAYAS